MSMYQSAKIAFKFRALRVNRFLYLFILLLSAHYGKAQTLSAQIKTPKAAVEAFMAKRFGMFIHWGPVTLRGTEIGWSRGHEVSQQEYDTLYKEFNPVLFNADAWVKTAKDAGMKYLTITAKHHDGFCLWPSEFTEYDIMSTPFKRDVVGELAKACKKLGIKFCIYYTILDWHDTDYPLHNDGIKEPDPKADMRKFITYMKHQLTELVTKYDPYMIWFDGGWESPWTREMGIDMYRYLKGLKKDLVINNRLGKEMAGLENNRIDVTQMIGDYDTPEQVVGKLNMDLPWESCITICNQWAWKPNDKMKSLKECVQTLAKTAGGNGNLLLNVGPMPDGRMESRQVQRLKEIGNWLSVNGEAVYNTTGGPFQPNELYAATRKGNKIYLHVFDQKAQLIQLPGLPGVKIVKAYFLNGQPLRFTQETGQNISIDFPGGIAETPVSVLVLELDKNADVIPVVKG